MHPIEKKLRLDIIPYFIAVRRLKHLWYYRMHVIYIYSHDLLAAIAAVGIAHPILTSLRNGGNFEEAKNSVGEQSVWLTSFVAACLIGWAYLKFFIIREDIEKKSFLIKSCRRQFISFEHELVRILKLDDPMPGLNQLYSEFQPIIDRSIQEGIIELPDLLDDEKTEMYTNEKTENLLRRFSEFWTKVLNENFRKDD